MDKLKVKVAIIIAFLSLSFQGLNATELPHYFPVGVIQSSDSLKQLEEYFRYLTATESRLNGRSPGILGDDNITIETDIESTSSALNRDKPTKMVLTLDHYVRLDDGRIRVTFTNDQVIISEHQLEVVKNDLLKVVNEAANFNFEYYKWLTDTAIKARAVKLGVSEEELKKILDLEIPGYKNITHREMHQLPRPMRRSDFIPRELHLGYAPPGILGMAWLNTGVVYYSPQARVVDYLNKKPKVLQHEMVHNNMNLQKFPVSEGFDVELMASIPEVLYPENQTDLFFHGYVGVPRELIWIYFGFNFRQVRKEVVRYDLGDNLLIDQKKYREYFQKLDLVKAELFTFYRDVVIPEFYSDPVFWSAMNEKRTDRNSLFRIMMAAYYNPTILNGEKNTMKWLEAHKEEIMEMAKNSYEKSGKPLLKAEGSIRIPPSFIEQYKSLFTEKEQEQIQRYFIQNPDELERISKMNLRDALNFLNKFKNSSSLEGR